MAQYRIVKHWDLYRVEKYYPERNYNVKVRKRNWFGFKKDIEEVKETGDCWRPLYNYKDEIALFSTIEKCEGFINVYEEHNMAVKHIET